MIKIYPNFNNQTSKINFGKETIMPEAAQEFIDAADRAKNALDTIANDPVNNSLAKRLSKVNRDGSPKINGTAEELGLMEDKFRKLGEIKTELGNASKKFANEGNVPVDNIPKWVVKMFSKFSNSKIIKYLAKQGPKGIAIALAAGNVGKEMVGTAVYTIQAMTNEDLPADKRKFIGMYDLVVGLISTTFSALFGFGAVAVQDKLIGKALKKNSGAGYPKYAAAFAGLVWLIPQFLQTIIGKRIVAPAIATPIAGRIKENMMAKAEAKKIALDAENNKLSKAA